MCVYARAPAAASASKTEVEELRAAVQHCVEAQHKLKGQYQGPSSRQGSAVDLGDRLATLERRTSTLDVQVSGAEHLIAVW